jgi:hypothetical protein
MSAGNGTTVSNGTAASSGRFASDPDGSFGHRPTVRPSTMPSSGNPGPGVATSASGSHGGPAAREPLPAHTDVSPGDGAFITSDPFCDGIVSLSRREVSVTRGVASFAGGTLLRRGASSSPPGRVSSMPDRTAGSWFPCCSTLAVTLPDALPSPVAATARTAAGCRALTKRPLASRFGRFLAAAPLAAPAAAPAPVTGSAPPTGPVPPAEPARAPAPEPVDAPSFVPAP